MPVLIKHQALVAFHGGLDAALGADDTQPVVTMSVGGPGTQIVHTHRGQATIRQAETHGAGIFAFRVERMRHVGMISGETGERDMGYRLNKIKGVNPDPWQGSTIAGPPCDPARARPGPSGPVVPVRCSAYASDLALHVCCYGHASETYVTQPNVMNVDAGYETRCLQPTTNIM